MFIWTFFITKTQEITSCSYALKSWHTLYIYIYKLSVYMRSYLVSWTRENNEKVQTTELKIIKIIFLNNFFLPPCALLTPNNRGTPSLGMQAYFPRHCSCWTYGAEIRVTCWISTGGLGGRNLLWPITVMTITISALVWMG